MARDSYDEDVDVEKTAADYDDERPEGFSRLRGPAPESMPSRAVKAAPRAAPKPVAKPAPKPVAAAPTPVSTPAPKAAPTPAPKAAPTQSRDFIDQLSPNNPLRKLRARGMGETESLAAERSAANAREADEIARRTQEKQQRTNPIADAFRAIRARGSQGTQSYAKGGAVSASRRADGCAQRGKTRGRMI
jgi:hypothetical protein